MARRELIERQQQVDGKGKGRPTGEVVKEVLVQGGDRVDAGLGEEEGAEDQQRQQLDAHPACVGVGEEKEGSTLDVGSSGPRKKSTL